MPFGILGSIGWGINYWPAFVSIYAVIILHYRNFNSKNLQICYLFINLHFMWSCNDSIFSSDYMFGHIFDFDNSKSFNLIFLQRFINELALSFKIIYNVEKSIILLIILTPFLFLRKNKNKNFYFIVDLSFKNNLLIFYG